ncbi:MAG: hypothetical protein KDB53_05385, partial [Planctomycetes bacterium]|nr:hypothetical protein [Planctomycetota bacterium]
TLEARMTPPNLSKVLLRELARCSRMSGEVLADRLANEAMVPALAECLKAIVEGRISDVAPVYAVLSRRLESGPRADLLDHLKRHWDELPPGPAGFDARMDLVPVLAESGDPDLEARLMDLVSQAMSREAGALTDDLQLIQDELAASAAASLVEAGRGVEGLFAMLVQHQVDVGLAQVAGEEPGDSEDLVVAVLAALTQTGFDAGEDDHLRRVWEALPPMSVALVPARLFASWAELSGFRAASPFLLERLLESTQTLESINPVRLEALALGMPAGPENDLDDLVARALRCAGRRSGFQVGRLTAALFWGLPLDQMPPGLVEGLLMAVDPPDRLSFSDERPPVELRRSEVLLRLERTLWERGRRDEAAQVMRGLLRDHGLSVEVLERFVDRAPSAKQAVLRQGFEAMAEGAGADSLIGPPSRWRR